MEILQFATFVLLFVVCVNGQTEERNARLLIAKDVLNRPYMIIENKDVILQYSVFNIGGSVAQKVSLSDPSLQREDVTVIHGMTNVIWERIPPGANVTHTVVVRPIYGNLLNLSAAEVSYLPSEDAKQLQYAYTSAPGLAEVMPYAAFDRKFNIHLLDWAYFALMTTPSLLLPFILWSKSRAKYEGIMRQARKASAAKQN